MSEEWFTLKEVKVGFLKNGTFYTYRKQNHFMRKFGGFGISSKIVSELLKRKINDIVFLYEGAKGKVSFKTTLMKILELGITETDYTFGFEDRQYFIPLKEMEEGDWKE
jgi:hypothetical protein